jgi:transposase InsO family protein
MCKILHVSVSGYYKYRKNLGKPDKDAILSAAMQEILDDSPYNDNYGAPRMQTALLHKGIKAGIRRITRLMREKGWLHKPHRKPKGLTHATTEIQEQENLIKQDFSSVHPLKKLLTDISQIQCQDGKLYISPILDCYNGEILSLIMRDNMKKELCIDTFNSLMQRYKLEGCILHSDRGSQYTSDAFRTTLKRAGVQQSLSGVDHCYDNSRMESFFATLKKELLYRIPTYRMKMDTVKSLIFRYVFTYYNQKRVYTANPGGYPPAIYRLLQEGLLAA